MKHRLTHEVRTKGITYPRGTIINVTPDPMGGYQAQPESFWIHVGEFEPIEDEQYMDERERREDFSS
ncbi:MAG: hypothetical protein GY906_10190 [bacterium]|nr:hypothetical protein [bacterium]